MALPCFHGTALVAWPRYIRKVVDDHWTLRCPVCKANLDARDLAKDGITAGSKCPGYARDSHVPGTCSGILRFGKVWSKVGVCDCKTKAK